MYFLLFFAVIMISSMFIYRYRNEIEKFDEMTTDLNELKPGA